jgi:hypothetical protein
MIASVVHERPQDREEFSPTLSIPALIPLNMDRLFRVVLERTYFRHEWIVHTRQWPQIVLQRGRLILCVDHEFTTQQRLVLKIGHTETRRVVTLLEEAMLLVAQLLLGLERTRPFYTQLGHRLLQEEIGGRLLIRLLPTDCPLWFHFLPDGRTIRCEASGQEKQVAVLERELMPALEDLSQLPRAIRAHLEEKSSYFERLEPVLLVPV